MNFAAAPPPHLARLDEASAITLGFPHAMLASDHVRNVTAGEMKLVNRH